MTSNNLLSNRDEPLGDNSAQQTPSTPEEEGLKAGASGTKNQQFGTITPRTQGANTAVEWCPKGCNNIKKWHKSPKEILCHNKKIYVPSAKKVYVPSAKDACLEVLKQLHNNFLARHFGFKRTLELIQRYYSWPGMIKKYINTPPPVQCAGNSSQSATRSTARCRLCPC